jgi:hypothetical protein
MHSSTGRNLQTQELYDFNNVVCVYVVVMIFICVAKEVISKTVEATNQHAC